MASSTGTSGTTKTNPTSSPTPKSNGTLSLLDKDTFLELLRTVGLPGLIIVAWLLALVTNQDIATNLMLWASILVGSIFVNFMVFQLSSWKDAIVVALKGVINQQSIQTIEILEMMMSSQNSMVANLNTLISLQEGGLTLAQVRKLIIFYLCESLKWKTWQTILAALDPAILATLTKIDLQRTVEIHTMAVLKQLSTYNPVMLRPEIHTIIHEATGKIFTIVFEEEHANQLDFASRVHQIMDAIKLEYDDCATKLDQFLGQVV